MSKRSWIRLVVAALFSVGNLVFAAMVAVQGEAMHSGGHALLALLGLYGTYRVLGRHRPDATTIVASAPFTMSPDVTDRLTSLEQSVDAVAVAVAVANCLTNQVLEAPTVCWLRRTSARSSRVNVSLRPTRSVAVVNARP